MNRFWAFNNYLFLIFIEHENCIDKLKKSCNHMHESKLKHQMIVLWEDIIRETQQFTSYFLFKIEASLSNFKLSSVILFKLWEKKKSIVDPFDLMVKPNRKWPKCLSFFLINIWHTNFCFLRNLLSYFLQSAISIIIEGK